MDDINLSVLDIFEKDMELIDVERSSVSSASGIVMAEQLVAVDFAKDTQPDFQTIDNGPLSSNEEDDAPDFLDDLNSPADLLALTTPQLEILFNYLIPTIDGAAEMLANNSSSRISGLYFEAGAGVPIIPGFDVGGEFIAYLGYDSQTGERIVAYYAGATATAGVSVTPPFNFGVGAFVFTGAPEQFGGPSFSQQISGGVTGGIGFTLDGEAIAFAGLNTSASATIGAGSTYYVNVGGEVIYLFGQVPLGFVQYEDIINYFGGERLRGNDAYLSQYIGDGVYLIQDYTFIPGGNFSQGGIGVITYLVDPDGNRLTGPAAEQILRDNGFLDADTTSVFVIDGMGPYAYSASWIPYDETGLNLLDPEECFLAGTLIKMADGTSVPIEDVSVGDQVLSFDADGALLPAAVTQLFQSSAPIILDFHGVHMTPGHVMFCAGGSLEGTFAPLIDILLSDGAVMTEKGQKVRASTGEKVGSDLDRFIQLQVFKDQRAAFEKKSTMRQVRLGTKIHTPDGEIRTIAQFLETMEAIPDLERGTVKYKDGQSGPLVFYGPAPNPEDFILQVSGTSLEQVYKTGSQQDGRSDRIVVAST